MYGRDEVTRSISLTLPESLLDALAEEAEVRSDESGRRVSISEIVAEVLLDLYGR